MNEQIIMAQAVQMKRAGRYAEARALYNEVIAAIPQCDPAYKGLAKVEIGSGRYEAAIKATLMKIDLGIFFTKQVDEPEQSHMWRYTLCNLQNFRFSPEIRFGRMVIPAGETYRRSCSDARVGDVAWLAYAESDVYFYLGHCLVRLYPKAFAHYSIPGQLMDNFESALLGHPSGIDARKTDIASIFYISGFWMAVANIPNVLKTIEPAVLRSRYNRELSFMGL